MKEFLFILIIFISFGLYGQNETQPNSTQNADTVYYQQPQYQPDTYNPNIYNTNTNNQYYNNQTYSQFGNISVFASSNIDALIQKHIRININKTKEDGFRIQLIQNSSRASVLEAKSQFLKYFPNIPTYLSYSSPYFKLRVGDYTDRLEAYRNYKLILRRLPNAFIVPDNVNISY